jgi:hypothetical protein
LTVARRTVTKYRKAMDIPSSRQRRDWTLGPAPGESKNGRHEQDGSPTANDSDVAEPVEAHADLHADGA